MTKRFLALACAMALTAAAASPSALALSGEASRAGDTLYTLGLVKGTTGSEYSLELEAPATRGTAVTMLVRLAGAEDDAARSGGQTGFRDVPAWLKNAVGYAAGQKWTTGVTAMEFRPQDPVTANAWCTFLLRMLGYSDSEGDFAVTDAAVFARHIGLTEVTYSGELSRGELFDIACDALKFHYKDSQETVLSRLISEGTVSRAAANALGLMPTELTARQVADRYSAAVFRLDCYEIADWKNAEKPSANATGFFIDGSGIAVTNYHSIDAALFVKATLSTGESYPVERVLYYDPQIDIAVIQVSRTSLDGETTSTFASVEMAGTADIRTGDVVYAISNPLGLGLFVSQGIISDPSRKVERYALPCVLNTADISMGSSGGALLNAYGQVIGVTAGAYSSGNSMYLAVPVDPAMTADLTGVGWTLAEVDEMENGR